MKKNPALPMGRWQEKMSLLLTHIGDAIEGDPDTPLQNMLFWYKDSFELKAIEDQQNAGRVLWPLPYLKAGHKFPFVTVSALVPGRGEQLITRDSQHEMSLHKQMLLE